MWFIIFLEWKFISSFKSIIKPKLRTIVCCIRQFVDPCEDDKQKNFWIMFSITLLYEFERVVIHLFKFMRQFI